MEHSQIQPFIGHFTEDERIWEYELKRDRATQLVEARHIADRHAPTETHDSAGFLISYRLPMFPHFT
jgi:hypothetical protein